MEILDSELRYNVIRLECMIDSLFQTKDKLTLSEIEKLLTRQKYPYTKEELLCAIDSLFIDRGIIIKNDFWDQEAEYIRVDRHRESSSYSKHYYSFKVDNYETKKFLLIADTHIDNDEMEDFRLLDGLYNYSINDGAKKCFHLGDLFTGRKPDENFGIEEKYKQIMKFIDNYPRPLPTEMMTYGLLGNNDLEIDNMFWHNGYSNLYYDLRELIFFNPSFYMFPRERWATDFLDKSFHFGHKFHHSMLMHDLKITCEEDLINQRKWLDSTYDVHISGHLHNGLIYGAGPSEYVDKDQLFLGVPSASRLNINRAVGYLVTLNYKNETEINGMDVKILTCDNNYKISELDVLVWDFNGNNNIDKKIKVL